ncbi:MAG: hypothetical protein PHU25_06525 [Deltaproteobacteria bacterium]|nr:hypothetical protein [Deltaproteobacteria bacterium]
MRRALEWAVCAALAMGLTSCGGAQVKGRPDPLPLLAAGKYKEARAAALVIEADGNAPPVNTAILALTFIAEPRGPGGGIDAAKALAARGGDHAALAGVEMVALTPKVPIPWDVDQSLLLVEAVLGGVGQGSYAPKPPPRAGDAGKLRELAVSLLETVSFAMSRADRPVSMDRMLDIWNGSFACLGGSLRGADAKQAWRLYRSLVSLALVLNRNEPAAELSKALLGSTVGAIEENPDISVAAKCDEASPFDELREAVRRDRDLRTRLETAVAAAAGCSRGFYAP